MYKNSLTLEVVYTNNHFIIRKSSCGVWKTWNSVNVKLKFTASQNIPGAFLDDPKVIVRLLCVGSGHMCSPGDSSHESVLSFLCVDPGVRLRSWSLAAGTFTLRAILPALSPSLMQTISLCLKTARYGWNPLWSLGKYLSSISELRKKDVPGLLVCFPPCPSCRAEMMSFSWSPRAVTLALTSADTALIYDSF